MDLNQLGHTLALQLGKTVSSWMDYVWGARKDGSGLGLWLCQGVP